MKAFTSFRNISVALLFLIHGCLLSRFNSNAYDLHDNGNEYAFFHDLNRAPRDDAPDSDEFAFPEIDANLDNIERCLGTLRSEHRDICEKIEENSLREYNIYIIKYK